MRDELIDQMERVQREHFWFRARTLILLGLLQPWLKPGTRVLDAGCGTGLLLGTLPPGLRLAGLDVSARALDHARARLGAAADLRPGHLPGPLPFAPGSQDLILLTDVLEHVENDLGTLQALGALLAPGGRIVLTVPAFSFLWSRHDEEHGHFRRYSPRLLHRTCTEAGLQVDYLSAFNTLLFPMVLGARLFKRITGSRGSDMDLPSPWLNSLLYHVFAAERGWVGRLRLPVGVSLIAVARPKGATRE